MERVLLTEDTVEYIPVRGVKHPVRLTGGEDKGSGKPIMVEHLDRVKNELTTNDERVVFTSPSGQTKVKLNPTGGAGCRSKKEEECFCFPSKRYDSCVRSKTPRKDVNHLTVVVIVVTFAPKSNVTNLNVSCHFNS